MPLTRVLVLAALFLAGGARAAVQQPHESVAKAAAAYAALEKAEIDRLSGLLDGLLSDPVILGAFRERDREKLFAKTEARFERLRSAHGITHWYFVEPEGRTCFLRVHAPTLFGDVIDRQTLRSAMANGTMGAGKELGKTAFALRVVKPIRVDGAVVGYMELGEEIGHFLVKMKEQTGDDFGLLVDKARVDRKELARVRSEDRWDERPDVVLVDSTVWNERLLDLPVPLAQIPDAGMGTGEWVEGGRKYLGGAFPVRDAANRIVGVLYVRHPIAK